MRLLAVVVRPRWHYLALLGAAATMVMQFGWVSEFFVPAKLTIAMSVFVEFAALFLGGFWFAHADLHGSQQDIKQCGDARVFKVALNMAARHSVRHVCQNPGRHALGAQSLKNLRRFRVGAQVLLKE